MAMTFIRSFKLLSNMLQSSAPYLLLEIVLPGGTLFAFLLFLYRRRQKTGGAEVPRAVLVIERVLGKVSASMALRISGVASVWRSGKRERDGLEALAMSPMM